MNKMSVNLINTRKWLNKVSKNLGMICQYHKIMKLINSKKNSQKNRKKQRKYKKSKQQLKITK